MGKLDFLHSVSEKQNGIVTRTQLTECGMHKNAVGRLIANGTLIKVQRGIYIVAGTQVSWLQHATIATFWCGNKAKLSHESVLQLYGLTDFRNDSQYLRRQNGYTRNLIHVTNPRRDFRNHEVFFHCSSIYLPTDHNNVHFGIPHVSLERALIDCSQQLTDHELSFFVERALRLGLTTIKRLSDGLQVLRSARGREKSRITKLVADMKPERNKKCVESFLEKRVEDVVAPYSIYELRRQFEVKVQDKRYRLDFAIPELMIAIEADGYQFHSHRSSFDADRMRDALLVGAGWTVLHVSAAMNNAEIADHFVKFQHRLSRYPSLAPENGV